MQMCRKIVGELVVHESLDTTSHTRLLPAQWLTSCLLITHHLFSLFLVPFLVNNLLVIMRNIAQCAPGNERVLIWYVPAMYWENT